MIDAGTILEIVKVEEDAIEARNYIKPWSQSASGRDYISKQNFQYLELATEVTFVKRRRTLKMSPNLDSANIFLSNVGQRR